MPVIWRGGDVIVVDKPSGMASEPGKGQRDNTMMNALFAEFGNLLQNMGEKRDFGLLHRLDRETSGLLIVALRARAYDALRRQFEERSVVKRYWAIVSGRPPKAQGVIRKPIAEVVDEKKQKKAVISGAGKPSATAYRVLSSRGGASLVECRIGSGRLHQIRVHMAAVGCPVLGDGFYAPPEIKRMAARLALHAHLLAFVEPESGERVVVGSPFPADLRPALVGRRMPVPGEGSGARGTAQGGGSGNQRAEPDVGWSEQNDDESGDPGAA
ncbi:MAG: RluA family pseudouridine synthase [Phycisphaerales bacterium]|nr:RluA family pseudouridine synthase [Phycisphaerales bacterium]